jgi:hypothetical protein
MLNYLYTYLIYLCLTIHLMSYNECLRHPPAAVPGNCAAGNVRSIELTNRQTDKPLLAILYKWISDLLSTLYSLLSTLYSLLEYSIHSNSTDKFLPKFR